MSDPGTATLVVTGISALTPLGTDVTSTWQRLGSGDDVLTDVIIK